MIYEEKFIDDVVVFYVDILGISSLTTQKNLPIKAIAKIFACANYEQHLEQHVAARILGIFNNSLAEVKQKYQDVNVTQLSDCAFFWGYDIYYIFEAMIFFMNKITRTGVLCRGGGSFGPIFLQKNALSDKEDIISGPAVSESVMLEGCKGKGARLFISENLATECHRLKNKMHTVATYFIQKFTNPLDYSVFDEFMWYRGLPPIIREASYFDIDRQRENIANLIDLIYRLRFSNIFSFARSSKAGMIHLAATIEAVSSAVSLFCEKCDDSCQGDRNFYISADSVMTSYTANNLKKMSEPRMRTLVKRMRGECKLTSTNAEF